jgi:TIR domain
MSDAPDIPPAPVVLVSYSHDSPEHKRWVGELAAKLVKKGVDVILDQWDTGPGDDLPKFMEKAVGRADRVLMICSDAYVQKADDGKGALATKR